MISNFGDKKLVEYLKPGQKVLIRFGHGLGDTIMFIPCFRKLQREYPEVDFRLYVESGQEEIWPSEKDKDAPGYDLVFSLNFPMSEGSNLTKAAKCCREEIGIEPPKEDFDNLPKFDNPLVLVHFQGTALPKSVNCPPEIAKKIWNEIQEAGKVPLEVHFEHCWHNPRNKRYDFVTTTVRGLEPKISKLIALIQHCYAFIGVASGPFVVAAATIPETTLYLQKAHPLNTYTDRDIKIIDLNKPYKDGMVKAWLQSLSLDHPSLGWQVQRYEKALQEKSLCKILWGQRSIRKKDWILIKKFLKEFKIKTVLEYGCGLSTELMELEGLELTCLESLEPWADLVRRVTNANILTYSSDHIPELGKNYDLAFVDGPQSGNRCGEVEHAKRHADLIYFHDIDTQRKLIVEKLMRGWGKPIENYGDHFYKKL